MSVSWPVSINDNNEVRNVVVSSVSDSVAKSVLFKNGRVPRETGVVFGQWMLTSIVPYFVI